MSGPAHSFLNHLKVPTKLSLGFGLVLFLTVLIAGVAWWSLERLSKRAEQFAHIANIDRLAQEASFSALLYRQSSAEADRVKALDQLSSLRAEQQVLQDSLDDPAELALARRLLTATDQYLAAFHQMTEALNSRARHLRQADLSAGEVVTAFDELQRNLVENRPFPSDKMIELGHVTVSNYRDLLLGRVALLKNEMHPDAAREQEGHALTQAVLERITEISASFNHQDVRLRTAIASLKNYQEAYRGTSLALAEEARAMRGMREAHNTVVTTSSQLYDALLAKRVEVTRGAIRTILLTALLAILLGLAIARLITRQIVAPLDAALDATDRIATGDLATVPHSGRQDEFGALERRVAIMRTALRDLIGNIGASATQIASSAEELSAVTTQTSEGARRQLAEMAQASQGMQEMTATVNDVAGNAEQASLATDNADREAKAANRLARQTLEQINVLADQVDRSMEAFEQLRQESQKIGSVLDVIKDVAEQTNLLALNAAIEAARAGEAGRGFAVVADEVRGLALRTRQSTQEIEALIASLQDVTQRAVKNMESSRALSERTVEMGQSTGVSLGAITEMVSTIQAMNQQIATAAEQQASVASELSRSVENIREVSEQTAAASGQTAAASQELARLGASLQAQVQRFRL
ncbi:MAG TPA: methyl-accepting chemotaxis protein [Pseudomonas sp.]|nr:methyl-accepting chemotaxis protein [Pseudomonas sp.]